MRMLYMVTALSLFLSSCGGSSTSSSTPVPEEPESRSFYMGFTPWLYEATLDAQMTTYTRLGQQGDLIKHHLLAGVPWQEALFQTPYHPNVEAEIDGRLSNTSVNLNVFLAIDSLNVARDGLSDYWAESTNMPLPTAWASRDWSSTEVILAYINFASDMIDRFQPVYFEYGTEVSELILNDFDSYDEYLIFAEAVYTELKRRYPNLILVTSIALKTPNSAEMNTIAAAYPLLMPYTDVLGVSVYPYVFFNHSDRGDPLNLPQNWLTQINSIANGKPTAISETGWIGEDLSIPQFQYAEMSNEAKQSAYVETLLTEADSANMEFVIWWTISDYDTLWNDTLGQDPLAKIWKDIGLYDGDQMPRESLNVWNTWLNRQRN